ncbi:hypothetical protein GGI22_006024, partial [Coemansia erecta]
MISPLEDISGGNIVGSPASDAKYNELNEGMSGVSLQEQIKNQGNNEMFVEISKTPQFDELSRKAKPRAVSSRGRLRKPAAIPEPESIITAAKSCESRDISPTIADEQHCGSEPDHAINKDDSSKQVMASNTPGEQVLVDGTQGEQRPANSLSDEQISDNCASCTQTPESQIFEAPIADTQIPEVHMSEAQIPDVQVSEVRVPNAQAPKVRTPETQSTGVQIPNVNTPDADVPKVLVPDVQMLKPPVEADIDPRSSPRMLLDEPRLDPDSPHTLLDESSLGSMLTSICSSDIADEGLEPTTLNSPKTAVAYTSDDLLDRICMELPDPETVCSPDFDHRYLKSNAFEPAHTLITARKERTHIQAIFEYRSGSFPISEDPSLWLYFQRQKYERWTALYPTCKRVKIQLVPQVKSCLNVNHLGQPQCRQCIKRGAGVACGFASVRYITLLTIELVDGTVAKRYLVCPIFRSEIEKAPAMRQPITPIVLPGRYVVENDNSWLEFHILCMTSSSIKSLLRRELAIVRDVQVSEARGFSRGTISFIDSAMAPQAVVNDNDNVVHPIYA